MIDSVKSGGPPCMRRPFARARKPNSICLRLINRRGNVRMEHVNETYVATFVFARASCFSTLVSIPGDRNVPRA